MNVDDVFDGEWKSSGEHGEEYCIECPYCDDPHSHNHCHINVTIGVFVCFACGARGTLRKLLYEHGGGAYIEPRKGVVEKKKAPLTDFTLFKSFAHLSTSTDRLALSYLEKRGVMKDEIEEYNMQFCLSGRYYGRVIVPIYEHSKLMCFSARAFMPYIEPTYLFPHYGETPLTTSEVLFRYDRVRAGLGKPVVIVEGVFDALSVKRRIGYEALAIMSNKMSGGQLLRLLELPKLTTKFYVMLDADAHAFALRIAWLLHSYRREEGSVRICFLESGDPDSATIEELRKAIDTAQSITEDLVPDMKRIKSHKHFIGRSK